MTDNVIQLYSIIRHREGAEPKVLSAEGITHEAAQSTVALLESGASGRVVAEHYEIVPVGTRPMVMADALARIVALETERDKLQAVLEAECNDLQAALDATHRANRRLQAEIDDLRGWTCRICGAHNESGDRTCPACDAAAAQDAVELRYGG